LPVLVVVVGVLDVLDVLVVGVGVEVEVLGGGALVVGGAVVVVGVQLMLALTTPAGREIADSGVPGGRSSESDV
jgi:hypothetical protein